ncbi:MAG: D-aminoacyl-tRNA deacylase [Bacteroidia bacterium]|jgi:D-tyrosyl-tRNA(Tyr) deacylase|nr:MAG: D-aminoacyl-tRNA deacylase [Bacteroidia bacterium]
MRALVQRVSKANIKVNEKNISSINKGLLVLLGIQDTDDESDITWLSNKIIKMRIFEDDNRKMNQSIEDIGGELLIVSQFTLYASTKKGNRPSFINAAHPDKALPIYQTFVSECNKQISTQTGKFGAMMQVGLVNDGPVTIWLDSRNKE